MWIEIFRSEDVPESTLEQLLLLHDEQVCSSRSAERDPWELDEEVPM